VVKALQDRINDLEARLHMTETPNVPVVEAIPESTPNNQPTPANLQKEAEEVGFLTTGGSDLYSGSKYGKLMFAFTTYN
jgi:hypothetical protein